MIRAVGRIYADAFRGLPSDVWRLSFGLFLNRAGTMVLPFLSLYLVRELGYGVDAATAALFAFGLGSIAGSYAGGELAGRVGSLGVQVASLILAGLAFLVVPAFSSLTAVIVAIFVASALNDCFRPAVMVAVVDASPAAVRARAMGLMRLAANAGIAVGPAVGGLLATLDYRWIFVGDAVTCWLAAAWLFFAMRGHESRRRAEADTAEAVPAGPSLWTDGTFLALLGMVLLASLVLFQAFNALPLYMVDDYGFDEPLIGLMFAFSTLLIVAFEMPLIKLLERREAGTILGFGIFLMCVGFGLLPFGHGLGYAALAVAVWTFGEMLWLPFSNVLIAQAGTAAGRTGQAMGMYSATFSVATVLAPVIGLPVLDRYGGLTLWLAAGLLGVPLWIGMAMLARRMRAS